MGFRLTPQRRGTRVGSGRHPTAGDVYDTRGARSPFGRYAAARSVPQRFRHPVGGRGPSGLDRRESRGRPADRRAECLHPDRGRRLRRSLLPSRQWLASRRADLDRHFWPAPCLPRVRAPPRGRWLRGADTQSVLSHRQGAHHREGQLLQLPDGPGEADPLYHTIERASRRRVGCQSLRFLSRCTGGSQQIYDGSACRVTVLADRS